MSARLGHRTALALALVIALNASPDARERTWTYAASANFEIYTTAGERRARETLADFERVHAFFADFLKLPPYRGNPTRILLFSTAAEYEPFRPNSVATAFYQSGADRDHIVMRVSDDGGLRTIVHEYTHAVVRRANADYPLWLNEGLADFFSTMESSGKQMKLGTPPPGRLRLFASGVTLIPLERLLTINLSSPEYSSQSHAGVFYSESWALTHMLLADERYRPGWVRLLEVISKGTSAATALTATYSKSLPAISRDLDSYVRRDHYGYWRAAYAPPAATTPLTRTATAFEAGVATANLLAASQAHQVEAAAAFEALSWENANDPSLLESRALFEFRRGERGAATPLMTRALAAGSRSLELRIRHAEFLANDARYREAIAELAAMAPVPASLTYIYFQVLANAHMQNGDFIEAKQAGDQVTHFARPGSEAEFARQFVQSIDAIVGTHTFADGRIKNVICETGPTVLEITIGNRSLRVAIDDPSLVKVQGTGDTIIELSCGAQDTPVRVGYLPSTNANLKTEGWVRFLDFRARVPYLYVVAGGPNGSVGAAAALTCQIVPDVFIAKDFPPVCPNVAGMAVA